MGDSGASWLTLCCFAIVGFVAWKIYLRAARRTALINKYGPIDAKRILSKTIWQGMSEEQLGESWGKPADINRTVYKTKTSEIWKYGQIGKNRYKQHVYVEDGAVIGWKG